MNFNPTVTQLIDLHTVLSVHLDYLDIWDVDMIGKPDENNKIDHHTDLYQSNYLIVRRGQEFQVKITFDRTYNPADDKFAVEFVIGEPRI